MNAMMYTRKQKIIIGAAIVGFVVIVALTLHISMGQFSDRNDDTYTDFRAVQLEPVDLELFGVSSGLNGDGLHSQALWIGEGYACTMEQNGQTGERISVPYVSWIVSNVNGNRGIADIYFAVAERAFMDEDTSETISPWRYSNIEITLLAGDETCLDSYSPFGRFSQGNTALENGSSVPMEVAVLEHGENLSVENAETVLHEKRQTRLFRMNSFRFTAHDTQGVQMRLQEHKSKKKPGYNLNGTISEQCAIFGLQCALWCPNRHGSSETEFPQTAHFKVTYDVENTVTGERTTHSTGWISRTYTASLLQ